MEHIVKASEGKQESMAERDFISILEANHGLLNSDRKNVIRSSIDTLIDKLLPDFVKCVFVLSEESNESEPEKLDKMMRCSKYQYKEMIQKKNVSDWEELYVIMNLDNEQRDRMVELKRFAQQSRKM